MAKDLSSGYSVGGMILKVPHIFTHLNTMTTCVAGYYYPNFTGKKTKALSSLINFHKVTQLVVGGARILTYIFRSQAQVLDHTALWHIQKED